MKTQAEYNRESSIMGWMILGLFLLSIFALVRTNEIQEQREVTNVR